MNPDFSELISMKVDVPIDKFWKALEIFLTNPQATSKNVAGAVFPESVLVFKNSPKIQEVALLVHSSCPESIIEAVKTFPEYENEVTFEKFRNILAHPEESSKTVFLTQKILNKYTKYRAFTHKCCIIDFQNSSLSVLQFPHQDDSFAPPFRILFSDTQLTISVNKGAPNSSTDKTIEWLKGIVATKFQNWMKQETSSSSVKSLNLIDCEKYNDLYNSLKVKYGTKMVEVWPEGTDPAKFVYEDVAIAAYLLSLWKTEREESGSQELQTFVDLGCGNGLLVYILTLEGHRGFGIDLRKRNIWDMYPKEVDLRVETIIPCDENLYPSTDWIIGNHSDELSPWVPVIAARSSNKCRFFLLPCCAFEFNGQKFQRRNSKVSQYLDFIEYAKEISTVCGYEVKVDRLKIPSTKRICLIGFNRSGRVKDFSQFSRDISKMISSGGDKKEDNEEGNWNSEFKPRETVEIVKNCTKVNKSVVAEIVDLVFRAVLEEIFFDINIFQATWNLGKGTLIGDLANKLSKEQLGALKSECGGLQTLLKNHNHIFEVQGGKVRLRPPMSLVTKKAQLEKQMLKKKTRKPLNFQQKPCFFFRHHPNGCPWSEETCSFKHGDKDSHE